MKKLGILVLVLAAVATGACVGRTPSPDIGPSEGHGPFDPTTLTEAPPPIIAEALDPLGPTAGSMTAGEAPVGPSVSAVPATTPGPGLLGDEWDSGPQQCDLNNLKILYRFQKINSPLSWDPHHWVVYYNVGAEDKNVSGPGWHYGYGITSINYYFSYGPNTTPITGTVPLSHVAQQNGVLAVGSGQGGFTDIQIRVNRSGGSAGMHMDWPGSGCAMG